MSANRENEDGSQNAFLAVSPCPVSHRQEAGSTHPSFIGVPPSRGTPATMACESDKGRECGCVLRPNKKSVSSSNQLTGRGFVADIGEKSPPLGSEQIDA